MSDLSRGRAFLFSVLLGIVVLLGLELLAVVALSWQDGEWVSTADRRAERDQARSVGSEHAVGREFDASQVAAVGGSSEVLHPFFGFVRDPAGKNQPWGGVSEFGFFDDRSEAERQRNPAEVFKVAVFGGSVANMLAFVGRERLIEELAVLDVVAGRPVEVRSFAMGGYKQPQQLLILSYLFALGERFDLVLNLDGFNEVVLPQVDNLPHGFHPSYPRGWPGRVQDIPDIAMQLRVGEIAFLEGRRGRRAELCDGFLLRASAICHLAWRASDGVIVRQLTSLRGELLNEVRSEQSFLVSGPRYDVPRGPDRMRDLADLWVRSSIEMHRLCKGRGIRYFHFLQPSQYLTGSKELTAEERRIAWGEDHPYRKAVERGYPALLGARERLLKAGVAYRDLTGIFANTKGSVYADTCCHLNVSGNQMLAARIGRAVVGELDGSD